MVVYLNILPNQLVFDDLAIIPGNPLLAYPLDPVTIFGEPYRVGDRPATLYRPLTVWTLAANHQINTAFGQAGGHPAGFHLLNVLLHALVGVAFFRWMVLLGVAAGPSLAAALIFAVHPIHTEAVDAVVGRAEILAALFGLLMLILHFQRRAAVLSAAAWFLALSSKESAVAFVALAFTTDVVLRRLDRRAVPAYGAYALTAMVWLGLRWSALRGETPEFPFGDNPLVEASLADRLLTAARVQVDYLRLQLLPVGLSSDYSFNQIPTISTLLDGRVIIAALIVAGAIVAAWRLRRSHPIVSLAIAGYAILLLPTSNFLISIGTIMAERLTYSASLMVALIAAYGGSRLPARFATIRTAVLVAVLLAFSGLTIARNRTWSDELTFYRAQVASAPNSAKAHYGLGTALAAAGDYRAAIAEYRRSISIFPLYADVFFNLANAERRFGADPEQVIAGYREAVRLDPTHTPAQANLLLMLLQAGHDDEARQVAETLRQLAPEHPALAAISQRGG